MKKPTKILVPLDFSATSEGIVNYARILADGFNASVHVLHVITDPKTHGWAVEVGSLPRIYQQMEEDARARLTALLGAEAGPAEIAISTGVPFAEILRYAEAHGIDLIVMGSHGQGGMLEQIMVGSVAEKVVRRAQCPVVIVRRPAGQG
jgi:nucleotide-binding universal stress UspA family protein